MTLGQPLLDAGLMEGMPTCERLPRRVQRGGIQGSQGGAARAHEQHGGPGQGGPQR